MHFAHLAETLPQVVDTILAEPDEVRQHELLAQLMGLLDDEEVIAMTTQLLSNVDLEELKEYPFLWQQYQRGVTEGQLKGELQHMRDALLEVLTARFDPSARVYLRIKQRLNEVTDKQRLKELLRAAAITPDLSAFEKDLSDEKPFAPVSDEPQK
jgi:hypothetical protein